MITQEDRTKALIRYLESHAPRGAEALAAATGLSVDTVRRLAKGKQINATNRDLIDVVLFKPESKSKRAG